MTERPALQRRIQHFRYGAYTWLAVELAVLAQHATPGMPVWVAAAASPLWAWLLCSAERRAARSLQHLENLCVPFVVGVLSLPLLTNVAVVGALAAGSVAQFGWRTLPETLLRIAAGLCGGQIIAPGLSYADTATADALCGAFIVLYTIPLCALGYEETMRMRQLRERVRATSDELLLQRDRLARYLAQPVAARLTAPAVAPLQRRWLTVAFVDIIDFTAMTERLAPEDLTALLDEFFAGLAELAEQHGGNLHKFLGDGALTSFGDVTSRGRDTDACACIAMLVSLAALLDRLNAMAQRWGIGATLGVRAGVASGYCSVGDFGRGQRLDYTMIGMPVNLASRLQALAAPGETWAAQSTRDLVGSERFDALGEVAVKGVALPLRVYRLRAATPVDVREGAH